MKQYAAAEHALLCAILACLNPCALSGRRSPARFRSTQTELLSALSDKGLRFDYAYAIPPPGGRALGAPVLDGAAMRLLRDEMGMTLASMSRRM